MTGFYLAESIASDFRDDSLQHQVVAFCVKGGKIINYGVNKRRYSKNSSVFRQSMHAEMDLIRKLGNKSEGSKIYIYRFNNANAPDARNNKNGKPCLLCQHVLKAAGVSRAFYLDDNNEVCCIKNRDMVQLIGEPSKITDYFLNRFEGNHHGKFIASEFIVG